MKLSIIIPAHNEEKRIAGTLQDYGAFFKKRYKKDCEIIIVLNGCKDNTLKVVKKFEKKFPKIRHFDFEQSGKGFALIQGFKCAKGDLIGFSDADDATSAEEFFKLIKNIEGFDGVIASRWMKGSVVSPKQPLIRIIAGRSFNFLNRILFGLTFKDTQCGAKIFRKDAIRKILPKLGVTEWAFDIDLLYHMNKMGFKIKEVPIKWCDAKGSKLNVPKTSLRMFLSIIYLRTINSPFKMLLTPFKPIIRGIWRKLK